MHKSVKLHIKEIIDNQDILKIKKELFGYTYRYCASHAEELKDINFINNTKIKFGLVDSEIRSIISKVVGDKTSYFSQKENECLLLDDLKTNLSNLIHQLYNTPSGTDGIKKIKRYIFNLKQKISNKELSLKSESIVYGGKENLRKISHLHNQYNNSLCEHEKFRIQKQIVNTTNIYQNKRIGNIYIIGEANLKGNRFFNFDFNNYTITYKPNKNKRVIFKLNIDKNRLKELIKIEYLANSKKIPITIEIIDGFIVLIYDSEIVSGYHINKKERNLEVKIIKDKKLSKETEIRQIKDKYKEFYDKQREVKQIGKLSNRFFSIDMNPDCIGYSIIDKIGEDFKIIKSGSFHLKSELTKKLGKSSNSAIQKKQNNKRKHEIKEVIISLFKILTHYKCYNFVIEELNFKPKEYTNTEFNRKTKNIWHRTLTTQMINKKISELGLNLIEVNPVYSSFIGNMMYKVFDATASSIEINRRGAFKFKKDKFFPIIDGTILNTAQLIAGDVLIIKDVTWKNLFTATTQKVGYRYRWDESVGKTDSFRSKSYKSKVICNLYHI